MPLTDDLTKELELATRYAMAAPLADNRRILDFGGHSVPGLVALAEAGARELVVASNAAAALTEALNSAGLEGIDVMADDAAGLADGLEPFDLIVCHDLPARLSADARFGETLRRLLTPDGYLMAAVANPKGTFLSEVAGTRFTPEIPYEELVDRIGPSFATLTVFGQTPVTGTLFFDFADTSEDTGLSLDRSLLPDEDDEAGWFVLLFGPVAQHRDDLAIVQLPFASVVAAAARRGAAVAPLGAAPRGEANPAATAGLREAQERIAQLEVERNAVRVELQAAHSALSMVTVLGGLPPGGAAADTAAREDAHDRLQVLETALGASERNAAALQEQLSAAMALGDAAAAQRAATEALQDRLSSSLDNAATLEATLTQAQRQVAQLEARAIGAEERNAALTHELAQTQERAMTLVGERGAAETQSANLGAQLAQVEREVAAARAQLAAAQGECDAVTGRMAALAQELGSTKNDKASYEAQITDLLEEVAQLRRGDDSAHAELQQLRDANTAAQQHILALQRAHQEAESQPQEPQAPRREPDPALHGRQTLQAEADRLTHEVARPASMSHHGKIMPDATSPTAGTVNPSAASAGARDAIGRQLENTVEELEDLLTGVAPPASTRR